MKKLNKYQRRLLELILNGVLATGVLLLSTLDVGYLSRGSVEFVPLFLAGTSFLMMGLFIVTFIFQPKTKIKTIRLFGLAGFYLVCFVMAIIAASDPVFYQIYGVVFLISIVYSATCLLIERRKPRVIVFTILKVLFVLVALAIIFGVDSASEGYFGSLIIIPLSTAVISFSYAMVLVFSGLRKKTLINIIRKTYAIEILYGLIVLIVATALMLSITEDSMENIGDALWYCFAIVTTIGFGDITATTIVGRLLSVVLGIYGIIVVALVTSIIVNFYNETKGERDEEIIEEMKAIEKEKNEEENDETEQ